MTSRFPPIVAWLAVAHAVLLGLAWLLLRVPESNALMLALSAGLAVFIVLAGGWVEGVGIAAWQEPGGMWAIARRGGTLVAGVLAALGMFGLLWWATGSAASWWDARTGDMDAWLMARFGWTGVAPLHAAVEWLLRAVGYGVGLSLAITLATAWPFGRRSGLSPAGWLRAACSARRLVAIALLLLVFGWLPWQAVYWRPAWLAPNWQETAFVTLKLALLYAWANAGWALLLRVAPRR